MKITKKKEGIFKPEDCEVITSCLSQECAVYTISGGKSLMCVFDCWHPREGVIKSCFSYALNLFDDASGVVRYMSNRFRNVHFYILPIPEWEDISDVAF